MDPAEQLYHLQLESQKQTQQLRRETTAGFEYLRKSAEASGRRVHQSLSATGPQSARSVDRGWSSSTRNIGGQAPPQEIKSPEEAVPPGLPADLRNILIRNQQMELRWQREFAERLRQAGDERPGASQARTADPRQQAEQRWAAQNQAAEQQRIEARKREIAELREAEQRARQQRAAESSQPAAASRTPPPGQGARAKGRGWGDSTRRIGSSHNDD